MAGARGAGSLGRSLAVLAALGCGPACFGGAARPDAGVELVEVPPAPPVEVVRALQERLQRRGFYAGPLDGRLSPETRVAVVALQRAAGQAPTGTYSEEVARLLGLPPPPRPQEVAPPVRISSSEEPSAPAEPGKAPSPQRPGAGLAAAREEAASLLAAGASRALEELETLRDRADPDPDELAARTERARALLDAARAAAFDRMLVERRRRGLPALPAESLARLEAALARRSLLVAGPDGRLGEDDRAAIRWLERRLGLPVTGWPSLRLLDALGVEPGPLAAP